MHGLLPLGGPCEGCNLVKLCTCVDARLQVGISTRTSKVHPHSYPPQVCVHVCTCSCTSHAYPCTHTQTDRHTYTYTDVFIHTVHSRSSVSKTASLNSHLHIHGHTSNYVTCYTFCTRSHSVVAVLKRGCDSGPCNNSLTGAPHPPPGLASIHKGHFTAV